MNESKHSNDPKPVNEPEALERLIARHLNELPELQAPPTLIPRVLAALEAPAVAWWRRPWFDWPTPWRIAWVIGLLILSGGAVAAGQWLWNRVQLTWVTPQLSEWFGLVSNLGQVLETLANAMAMIVRSFDTPWILAGASVAFAAYLACIGLGTVCARIIFRPAQFNSESK